jgi:hypothetical protein
MLEKTPVEYEAMEEEESSGPLKEYGEGGGNEGGDIQSLRGG